LDKIKQPCSIYAILKTKHKNVVEDDSSYYSNKNLKK